MSKGRSESLKGSWNALDFMKSEAIKRAPEKNLSKYKNKHAQRLSDFWFSQRKSATVEQKNKVGLAYISKVLGLGDDVAQLFTEKDQDVYHRVGMRQGGVEAYTPDLVGFWAKVRELFPEAYGDKDMRFLVEYGGIEAVREFLFQLEVPLAEDSPILKDLSANAHAYK
jgi:hypothetical protein